MALASAITDIEQLKSHPALARLLEWNTAAVQAVKFDREELTVWIDKHLIRDACAILRDDPQCPFNYLCDVTAVIGIPQNRGLKLSTTCCRSRKKSGSGLRHGLMARAP